MENNFLKDKNILFFGLENCINSKLLIEFLINLGCNLTIILGRKRIEKLPKDVFDWNGDFIFSYRCYWLIPLEIIKKAKYLAINFHPATPDFPGSGSCNWAIYSSAKEFGLTVHLMNELFDNGKILKVYKFKIKNNIDVDELIKESYKFSFKCFKEYINELNKNSSSYISFLKKQDLGIKWSSKAKNLKELNEMRKINLDMSKIEIEKRIKAFHMHNYPIKLFINDTYYELISKENNKNFSY